MATTLSDAANYATDATGNLLTDPQHPAGYPALLALIGLLTRNIAVTIIIQHALGIVAGVLLFAAVRRLTGSARVALVPAAVVLLNPDEIFLEHNVMSEGPFLFVVTASLYAGVRSIDAPRRSAWRWAAAAGLAIALAAITRSAGLFIIPVLVLGIALARPAGTPGRWGASLAAFAAATAVLTAYAFANDATTASFSVVPTPGWHLYARVAPFADCRTFTPPRGTANLCENTPADARSGPDFYLYDPTSPARRTYGRIGQNDDRLGAFAIQAFLHQPASVAHAVWVDIRRYYVPSWHEHGWYKGWDIQPQLDWGRVAGLAYTRNTVTGLRRFFAPFTQSRDHSLVEVMDTYQRVFGFGGTLLTACTLLIFVGLCVGPRRQRVGVFLFGVGGLAQLLIPTIGAVYMGRYLVPVAGFVAAGAAISAAACTPCPNLLVRRQWRPRASMSDRGVGISATVGNSGPDFAVFINYRRDDTGGQARLLTRELRDHFGKDSVYFDVDEKPGIDWLERISDKGAGAAVFLALIGPHWLDSLKARAVEAQLAGSTDFVRREIEWALQQWPGAIIPVLIDAPPPPPEQLPRSIEALPRKQGVVLRHARFDDDLANIVMLLDGIRNGEAPPPELPPESLTPVAPRDGSEPASSVPAPDQGHYNDVIDAMLRGTVVPLLGASLRAALPDARYLATRLANEFNLGETSSDLAEIAQHIAVTHGEAELYTVTQDIVDESAEPMPVHEFLAELPGLFRERGLIPRPQLIISTNYDCALEKAFQAKSEPFDYAVYVADEGRFAHFPWDEQASGPTMTRIDNPRKYLGFPIDGRKVQRTVIVKIHGAPDAKYKMLLDSDSYVITEDHYINYLPTHDIHDSLPIQILDKLKGSRRLFLGYALRSWNARMVLRRIWQDKARGGESWAIANRPDALEESLWTAVGGVKLLSAHSSDYIAGLSAALSERLEQSPVPPVSTA